MDPLKTPTTDPLATPTQPTVQTQAATPTAIPAGELPYQTYERTTGQKWGTPSQMAPVLQKYGITAAPGSSEANSQLQQKLIAQPSGAPATGTPTQVKGETAPGSTVPGTVPGAAPTTTTDTGKAATNISDIIKNAVNPKGAGLEYVDASNPDVQKFATDKKAALDTEKEATKSAYAAQQLADERSAINSNNNVMGMVKNKLAELGILDTSTASVQYMADTQRDADAIIEKIRSKYAIMNLDLDAKEKSAMIDAVNTQIKDLNDRVKTRIDQLQKGADIAGNFYKTLSDQEIAQEKNKLDKERLAVDDSYNKGKLSIDAYNAELDRIKNEKDAIIRSRQVDVNAYQADTNRMKVNADSGSSRIPYDQWIKQQSQVRGQSLDSSSPQLRAEYYQQNPVTLKQLNKTLDTEQATRKEVVQDMIDKGEVGLEQAQMIHPDIAPLLVRKGMSALQKMYADLGSFSSDTGGAAPVDQGGESQPTD